MGKKLVPCYECGAVNYEKHYASCQNGKRLSAAAYKGLITKQNAAKRTRVKARKKISKRKAPGLRNEVLFVIDRSSSMLGHWQDVKRNMEKGFYTSFLNEQPLWLTGPAYGPNFHLWQIRVKKAFDRDDLSSPPGLECYDEVVERTDWLTRDWEKGSISQVE